MKLTVHFIQNMKLTLLAHNTQTSLKDKFKSEFHSNYVLGLQMTDVELDERVTALEENSGGNTRNDKRELSFIS